MKVIIQDYTKRDKAERETELPADTFIDFVLDDENCISVGIERGKVVAYKKSKSGHDFMKVEPCASNKITIS